MKTLDVSPEEAKDAKYTPDNWWKLALSGKSVCILTFGCAYNTGDSDILSSVLTARGCRVVSEPHAADVIIINTCIVIGSTERRMLKLLSSYPDQEVIVTGCLPLALPSLIRQIPHIRVIHPDSIHRAAKDVPLQREGPVQVVQVGPGCMGSCRYCITRLARGTMRSIPEPEIISHIEASAKSGVVEIRLAGQDLSAYGMDTCRWSLASLLRSVPSLPDSTRIRLGMMNPKTLFPIAGEVAQAMKEGPFFSFLHLPVQSGSDRILDLMGRGYRISDILHIVDLFRSEMPDITIATDIITGFPGETDEDHKMTMDLLRQMKPGMVNVTRYSWRPGTGMGREDELPDRIRKDRSRAVVRESYAMFHAGNTRKIGSEMRVLTTEVIRPGSVMARSLAYEGVVIHEEIPPGQWCSVRITGCTPHYLNGEVVRD